MLTRRTGAAIGALVLACTAAAAVPAAAVERYIVMAESPAQYEALKAHAVASGARIAAELPQLNAFTVAGASAAASAAALARQGSGVQVAREGIRQLQPPDGAVASVVFKRRFTPPAATGAVLPTAVFTPDPAFSFAGLLWAHRRIDAHRAWRTTAGEGVDVAVADTGIDVTHVELSAQVASVVDLSNPDVCDQPYGLTDADLAAEFGGPPTGDWHGHGTAVAGSIAAEVNGTGTNGIAPRARLHSLKVAQWCGMAGDTELLGAVVYAADAGIDVVDISIGGYADLSDPDQQAVYEAYLDAVAYAHAHGTVVIGPAGDQHVRVDGTGRVVSHGPLTVPGDPFDDLVGTYRFPTVPRAVSVSATNKVVAAPSPGCPPGTTDFDNATCKPQSDSHQPSGIGKRNQLAYYSNYGPGIDVAAPGGARKFNLPAADRGGTPGFPFTSDDGTTTFWTFSTTSNWSTGLSCFTLPSASGFPEGQCYTAIEGTAMAAAHAAAVLALIASDHPNAQGNATRLIRLLKSSARTLRGNTTPGLSADDASPGDLTGLPCPTGYCHLGGRRISDADAYGSGMVDAD